ncbi:MAG: DUF3127 domain-containing protein [Bacteroidota bacterium]|jgi:hypothetical protein
MALEVTGKLILVLPEQTGTGKNGVWKKQDIIIETTEQFPKKISLSLWGDKVDQAKNYQIGQSLKVIAAVESREFNGRWYTDVKPFRIDLDGATTSAPMGSANALPDFDLTPDPINDSLNDLPF